MIQHLTDQEQALIVSLLYSKLGREPKLVDYRRINRIFKYGESRRFYLFFDEQPMGAVTRIGDNGGFIYEPSKRLQREPA